MAAQLEWPTRKLQWEGEPRLRRWTCAEYHRMAEAGILGPEERVELIDGQVIRKWTAGERRRWSCEEFERMGEAGILGPQERVELLDGDVLEMSPQRSQHATGITLATRVFLGLFGDQAVVRIQLPLRLFGSQEPEPDVAVVPGAPEDYLDAHPDSALLVVEISDTTLEFDQKVKASQYAAAGIPEYWIVDLVNGRVEARRDPVPMPGEPFGHGYRTVTLYQPGDGLSPLAAPHGTIAAAELLPRQDKTEQT